MSVLWLDEIGAGDVGTVGGKGASLGELAGAGLPVPPAFVVTADTYRSFLESAGIADELAAVVDVDPGDSGTLADAASRAKELILEAPVPDDLESELLAAHDELDREFVAVRSSATAEDLPEASFAGQQETFLNVTREELLDRVRRCWASLFTPRAIAYRDQQGFDGASADVAVVVQAMVDAEKSGVTFTSQPSTGAPEVTVEAAWGLGEAVVAGEVSPDNYVLDRETGDVRSVTVADKRVARVRDGETGETVRREVDEGRREQRVLSARELEHLREVARRIEDHYGRPQDVEWAIADGDLFVLQSRPITTIEEDEGTESAGSEEEHPESAGLGDATSAGPGETASAKPGDAASAKPGDAASAELGERPGSTGSDERQESTTPRDPGERGIDAPASGATDGRESAGAAGGQSGESADAAGASPGESADAAEAPPGESADAAEAPPGITDGSGTIAANDEAGGEVLVSGHGASPGAASGAARVVRELDQLDRVGEGDVIVTEMTTPDMVPAMQRAAAIVTDEGGLTCHAAIVSRELGVPAVVGAGDATATLDDDRPVTVDGDRGVVEDGPSDGGGRGVAGSGQTEGAAGEDSTGGAAGGTADGATGGTGDGSPAAVRAGAPAKPMTATEVKVNVSVPAAAERAAATGADGVGLLRIEHLVLGLEKTPARYVADHGGEAFARELADGIRTVADEFYPRPVRVRTLDAPTDEFRELEGGADEPVEPNPMLGHRGIRRSLAEPDVFAQELAAFARCYEMGYDNVEVMFPLVNDAEDVLAAKAQLREAGIDPDRRSWGAMIETPAAALSVEAIAEAGVDFVSFGTNDLTQYTLAVDRNNERVADRYDALHPAVLELIGSTVDACRERGVDTSICGEAGSRPRMVEFLVDRGVSSISANIDAVRDVQRAVERVEQRLLLDAVR